MSSVGVFGILTAVLLSIGAPIAVTVGLSSIIYILMEGIAPMIVIQRLFAGVDAAALLAIPFFILAGDLMNRGGIAKRLVRLANKAVGNRTGGGHRGYHRVYVLCRHIRKRRCHSGRCRRRDVWRYGCHGISQELLGGRHRLGQPDRGCHPAQHLFCDLWCTDWLLHR